METTGKIEEAVMPFKIQQLAEIIAEKKKVGFTDALHYLYDMVMGPVASDSLYATLLLYEQGVLSVEATVAQLKTHTLFDRFSFHTLKAIEALRFVKTLTP
jgi:hypothetical protein